MKGFLKLLFSRVGMVSLGILLQLIVLVVSALWFREYAPVIRVVSAVLAWGFVLYLLAGKSNPAYRMVWLILILGFPVLGVSLYLIFGGNRLSKRLRRKMEDIDRTQAEFLLQDEAVLTELRQTDPEAAVRADYLIRTAHCPVWRNTETEYFDSGETAFARMLADLEQARETVYLEYFIVAEGEIWERFLTVLRAKVAEGVDVRLLYDDFGCIRRVPSDYVRRLEAMGIRAKAFNRFVPMLDSRLNNRDHRKFMIIDGRVAYTGGVNLADEYANVGAPPCGHWKDCAIRLRGDAVWSMTVMFLSMWNHFTEDRSIDLPREPELLPEASGWVQPYVDSPLDDEAVGRTVFLHLINRAERYVWIMTPYLILDEAMTEALTNAAKSGIDVRIITPGIPDKAYVYELTRANYGPLLEGGVRIFEYSPGFVHSKLFLTDDLSAVVGTVNLDFRSLYLHFEDGVLLYGADCVSEVRGDFDRTFPQCREVTPADAKRVRLPRRICRAVLRLLSPLM